MRIALALIPVWLLSTIPELTRAQTPPATPDTAAPRSAALADTVPPGWRDPRRARRLAWYGPGVGHFYTGDAGRGLLLAGSTVFIGSIFASAYRDWNTDPSDDGGCSPGSAYCPVTGLPSAGVVAIGSVLAVAGIYVYSLLDADDSARRMNEVRARARLDAGMQDGRLSVRMGLQIMGR